MIPRFAVIAESLAGRVLNTAVEGVVLTAALWVLLRILGRNRSRIRFAIWFAALLAIAALPFLFTSPAGASPLTRISKVDLSLPAWLAQGLMLAWLAGASFLLLRLVAGLWRVRQLRSNCSELDITSLPVQVSRHLENPGALRRVTLCTSDEIKVPTAIGFFGPAVVFPTSLASQLSPDEMEAILLHELAHLHRWDDWTNLSQKLIKAVFFFHPAVWWIERRLALEREMACDEMVIAQTGSAKEYAALLISFTEKLQALPAISLVQGLVSRVCQLSLRIAEILAAGGSPRTSLRKSLLALTAGVFAAIFGITANAPQLVHFAAPISNLQASSVRRDTFRSINGPHDAAARMIPAAYHPQVSSTSTQAGPQAVSVKASATAKKIKNRRAATKAKVQPPSSAPVFVILQRAEYDLSGSGVWSICVWRVETSPDGTTQLRSAFVMKI